MVQPGSPVLAERLVPRRRAAAATSYAESDDSDAPTSPEGSPFKSPTRPKASVSHAPRGKGKSRTAAQAALTPSKPAAVRAPKRRKVAAAAPKDDDEVLSDASSALSAPPESPVRPWTIASTHRRTPSVGSLPSGLQRRNIPGLPLATGFGSGLVRSLMSLTSEESGPSVPCEDKALDWKHLGTHVWARLSFDGEVLRGSDEGAEGMWWPAEVRNCSCPLDATDRQRR
jgi:hypothetical protein